MAYDPNWRPTPRRTTVFISYSHRDRPYLDQLHLHLRSRVQEDSVALWDDTRLRAGDHWREQITQGLATARVAVLLVSADFLASSFITQNELPPLLEAAEREGAVILPVFVRPCLIDDTPLELYQGINSPDEPLSDLPEPARERVWVNLIKRIREALAVSNSPTPHTPPQQPAHSSQPANGSGPAYGSQPGYGSGTKQCPRCGTMLYSSTTVCSNCGTAQYIPGGYEPDKPKAIAGRYVLQGPDRQIKLNSEPLTIGYSMDNRLILGSLRLSARHAVVQPVGVADVIKW